VRPLADYRPRVDVDDVSTHSEGRLDAEEVAARSAPSQSPTAAQARAYLEDLPRLWKETSPEGRRGLAQAIFNRVDVLEATDYTITLTPGAEAHGFAEAFGREFTCSIGGTGRGERGSPYTPSRLLLVQVMNVPADVHRARDSA
jgi:hypothetical protein